MPGTCDTLLPLAEVDRAIGTVVRGHTAFVVGLPEKDIGRLAYLNCRYGAPPTPSVATASPGIEIGVSRYHSASQARRRLTSGIADFVDHGATRSALTVSGHDGALLVGASGPGYDVPLVVVSSGQRTVAVSVLTAIAPAAQRGRITSTRAALALARTGD